MTDAKEADQEANQGKLSIEGQNNDEQKLQGNEKSTDEKEADQEADQAYQQADQGKPTNEESNKIEEELQGNKKPTQAKGNRTSWTMVAPKQTILPKKVQNPMTTSKSKTKTGSILKNEKWSSCTADKVTGRQRSTKIMSTIKNG